MVIALSVVFKEIELLVSFISASHYCLVFLLFLKKDCQLPAKASWYARCDAEFLFSTSKIAEENSQTKKQSVTKLLVPANYKKSATAYMLSSPLLPHAERTN